jgi:predicted RNase H-like nuclease (RuvC/YqgF family)
MLQAMMAKKVIDVLLKRIMEKREVKKLRKYVEEDNELDIQVKQLQKTIAKQGRIIEELEKDNAILKSQSHPPIFSTKDKLGIESRLTKLELKINLLKNKRR